MRKPPKKHRQSGQKYISHVTYKSNQIVRYVYRSLPSSVLPEPPVIAAPALRGRDLSFLDFLSSKACQPYLDVLFSGDTAAATMLRDFRYAKGRLYFGHRRTKPGCRPPKNPGKLDQQSTWRRGALTEFARRAYRGDPQRRGQIFWKRVAGLIWQSYVNFMKLRAQCNDIKRRELKRIAGLANKRRKVALRVQRYRARKKQKTERRPR